MFLRVWLLMYDEKGVPFRICLYNFIFPPPQTFLSSLVFVAVLLNAIIKNGRWLISIMIIIKMLIISGRLVCCFYCPIDQMICFLCWPAMAFVWPPRTIHRCVCTVCTSNRYYVFITDMADLRGLVIGLSFSLVGLYLHLVYRIVSCLLFMLVFFLALSSHWVAADLAELAKCS
jgi:hypothetical protein